MSKEKNKKSGLFTNIIIFIFLIFALLTSGYLIYNLFLLSSIETLIRYIVIGLLGLFDLFLIFKSRSLIKNKVKKKKKTGEIKKPKKWLFILMLLIYSAICGGIGYGINYLYSKIDNVNKDTVIYSSSLLVMSSNPANAITDIKNMEIAILGDKKNPEGYIIPQEIIKENKLNDENQIVEYDDYTSMLVDLYANEINAIFVSSSYSEMFSSITGYENIKTDTKIITYKEKEMKKTETSVIETASAGKSVTEPFTLLLMGIDSTDEVLSKNAIAHGDTLILITFNPKTLNATMISIPRDSYIPIACWSGRPENKITHAAMYGNDCMINTIQNYFDVNIDYYAKINFKGLVKLVDAVGGVEVDVPQVLCTDDSSRGGELCINPGRQVLNGEQALVFARNRKAFADGDFRRAQLQQEIIKALVDKLKNIKDVTAFMNILNTVSNSLDTNLTTKQILSFYDVAKNIVKKSLSSEESELVNIQQLYLTGTGQMIYDERAKMVLWDYVPNPDSRKDIIQAMKENLELVGHQEIKSFSFSINIPYEKEIIGKGPYRKGFSYSLLPSFIGMTKDQAEATAKKYGVAYEFEGTKGTVTNQSYPERKRIDLIKDKLILKLETSKDKDDKDKDEDEKDKDKDKEDKENNENKDDDKETPKPSTSPSPSPSTSPSPEPSTEPEENTQPDE